MTGLSFSAFSKLTHVVESISTSLLFMNEYYSTPWIYYIFAFYSSLDICVDSTTFIMLRLLVHVFVCVCWGMCVCTPMSQHKSEGQRTNLWV